jgi:hypothetical protein
VLTSIVAAVLPVLVIVMYAMVRREARRAATTITARGV